jgi:hypothetical protein
VRAAHRAVSIANQRGTRSLAADERDLVAVTLTISPYFQIRPSLLDFHPSMNVTPSRHVYPILEHRRVQTTYGSSAL